MRLFNKQNTTPSGHRAAWEQRETIALPEILTFLGSRVAGGHLTSERWKNERKYNADRPSLGEIVNVSIGRTADTGDTTVTLTAVDGRRVTLWLRDGQVKSITNY